MFNVFDFDKYNPEMVETLGEILVKHGIAKRNIFSQEYLAKKRAQKELQITVNRHSGWVDNCIKPEWLLKKFINFEG